jgi:hypothetical protein
MNLTCEIETYSPDKSVAVDDSLIACTVAGFFSQAGYHGCWAGETRTVIYGV